MKDKVKLLICAMVCVTLIICGTLLWPTLYRHDKIKLGNSQYLVRVNRLTGYAEILKGERGWLPAGEQKPIKSIKIDPSQRQLIKGKAHINNGYFTCDIYNGTDYNIHNIKVKIIAKEIDGTTRWDRSYITLITSGFSHEDIYLAELVSKKISPQSKGYILAELSDASNISSFDWHIEEVIGYKATD